MELSRRQRAGPHEARQISDDVIASLSLEQRGTLSLLNKEARPNVVVRILPSRKRDSRIQKICFLALSKIFFAQT
jgi:hypothetical protein